MTRAKVKHGIAVLPCPWCNQKVAADPAVLPALPQGMLYDCVWCTKPMVVIKFVDEVAAAQFIPKASQAPGALPS